MVSFVFLFKQLVNIIQSKSTHIMIAHSFTKELYIDPTKNMVQHSPIIVNHILCQIIIKLKCPYIFVKVVELSRFCIFMCKRELWLLVLGLCWVFYDNNIVSNILRNHEETMKCLVNNNLPRQVKMLPR